MLAVRSTGCIKDETIRLTEDELKRAVALFLRSRGVHATADVVRFTQSDGEPVADVAVRVASVKPTPRA